jgi:hypothetical protein
MIFIYPKWKKYTALRYFLLTVILFLFKTSDPGASINIKLKVTRTSGGVESIDLWFASIKEAEDLEKRLRSSHKNAL